MKDLLKRSIKYHFIVNIIMAFTCIGVIVGYIHQTHHYHKLLEKQTEQFQITLEEMTDSYLEVVKTEEPMKNTKFSKRNLGKFTLSWYSPKELGKETASQLRTSRGLIPKEGRTIAVDPSIIPYGSAVYIEGYGYFIAEDCGGAIKGNRIDIFTNSYTTAIQQGKKSANVWIIGKRVIK